MKKLVSVLMSTKDTKKEFLIKSIESILKQTYKYFEFIIICDGGLNDYNIVKNIKDSRIKIVTHEKSIGLTKSLNEGIKYCSGEYIARMDSDDYSLKNRLKKQVEFLENNSDYDICSSFTRNFGKNKKFNITLFNDNEWIKSQLFVNNIISHPAIMIRKSFLLNNKINYNEFFVYSQDYELWCRCKNKTKIFIIPSILLLYRVHDSQISTAKILEQRKYKNEIIMKNFNELNLEKSESNMDCIEFFNNISLATVVNSGYNIECLTPNLYKSDNIFFDLHNGIFIFFMKP